MAIEAAAESLADWTGMRMLPRPPSFLVVRGPKAGEFSRAREQILAQRFAERAVLRNEPTKLPEAHLRVVIPHWNDTVRRLGKKKDGYPGYSGVLALRERLQKHLASLEEDMGLPVAKSALLQRVQFVFEQRESMHGSDALATEALDGPDEELDRRGEMWFKEGSRYVLDYEEEWQDPVWKLYAGRIRTFRYVHFGETWGTALQRVREAVERVEQELEPLDDKSAVIKFRLRVVEQVLTELEVLGYVSELTIEAAAALPAEKPDLNDFEIKHLLLIVLAHQHIQQDPYREVSRSAILGGKKGEKGGVDAHVLSLQKEHPDTLGRLPWHAYVTGGTAYELASKPPIDAFEPYDYESESDRESFDERFMDLYERIKAAGVETIDDVICEIRRRSARSVNQSGG